MFEGIIRIIREPWLERNTDRHRLLQGQKLIAKITEATQTVIVFRSLIMPQHKSRYFAMPLEEMLGQSAPRMLTCVTRWKTGIYQSVHQAKLLSIQMTIPIWKIWDHNQTDRLIKKVDKTRITQSKQNKYKITRITTKLKVTGRTKSTSRVTEHIKGRSYLQATFDDLETVVLKRNDALYGNAFND